jgi:L,D-peptidoglycan transpeptidase YkuD (ErfK/YbiS/YcfS/YnhG family)
VVGKAGFIAAEEKREGDHKTPLGVYDVWPGWYRSDRISVDHPLLSPLPDGLGWCDDPTQAEYNQAVQLPHAGSCEVMKREDHCYDVVFPTSHNQQPVVPGAGSAIFFHLAREDYSGTEGCVAVAKDDMLKLLPYLDASSRLVIRPE